MAFKITNSSNNGDSTHFGPADIDKFSKYLSGYDLSITEPADVATQTYFRSSKLQIRDPSNANSIIIAATDGNAADRTLTIPALSSSQGIVTTTATQTLTNKTMDWNSNTFLNFPSGGGGSGDMILASVQTVTGAKTFNDTKLLLRNPANTFSVTLGAGAQTGAQTFTFPVTTSDTIATIAATQTFTNKTLTSPTIGTIVNTGTLTLPTSTDTLVGRATTDTLTNKTFNISNNSLLDTTNAVGDLLTGNGTKYVRFAMGTANQVLAVNGTATGLVWTTPAGGGDATTNTVQTFSAAKTFLDTDLLLRNPANTFSVTLGAGAQSAARTFTFPVTASDTIETIAATQTVTNKTLSVDLNTLNHSTTNAAGDILKSDGTKMIRLARGTANQVLAVNAGGTDIAWSSVAGGGNTTIFPDYIVYNSSGTYVAVDTTGATISNANFTTLMNQLSTNLTTGGTVFIKKGTYDVPGQINMNNGISVIGAGRGQTIIRRTTTAFETTLLFGNAKSNCAHLTMDGNYTTILTDNGSPEIYAGGNDIHIYDVEIKNFGYCAIEWFNQTGIVIEDCIISGNATTLGTIVSDMGILPGDPASECRIINCQISGVYYNAVFCVGTTTIQNCYFKGNGVDPGGQIIGAGPNKAVMTKVQDCIFDTGGQHASGIEMDYGYYIITGNLVKDQPRYGIVCNSGTHLIDGALIANNVVKNCGSDITAGGIELPGAQTNFTITGNICYDDKVSHTQAYGIIIDDPAANKFVIENNVCYNNTQGQILDLSVATDKVIRNNIPYISAGTDTFLSPVLKRSGSLQPAGGTTSTTVANLTGSLGSYTVQTGGTYSTTFDAAEGMIANIASPATSGVVYGLLSTASGGQYRTAFGVRATVRFKMGTTTSSRFYFGFAGVTSLPISDTPMATAIPGILVGFAAGDTNFTIRQNDAVGAVTVTNITGPIAKNTSWHTIEIYWDGAGTAVYIRFDGSVPQKLTTDIPATTSDLWFHCQSQTAAATAQTLSLHGVWVEAAK